MENKIQELTEKIYKEGVEKGNAEAKKLLNDAEQRAERILAAADQKAAEIEAEARATAEELEKNTKSELKLYAAQALNALKSEIATLITEKVTDEAVKGVGKEGLFKEFVLALAQRWSADEAIVISTSEAENLKAYFAEKAKSLLDKGVTIREVNGKKTQITIAPVNGQYKINFGEEEFENYFKTFLRPQLIEMLF